MIKSMHSGFGAINIYLMPLLIWSLPNHLFRAHSFHIYNMAEYESNLNLTASLRSLNNWYLWVLTPSYNLMLRSCQKSQITTIKINLARVATWESPLKCLFKSSTFQCRLHQWQGLISSLSLHNFQTYAKYGHLKDKRSTVSFSDLLSKQFPVARMPIDISQPIVSSRSYKALIEQQLNFSTACLYHTTVAHG